MITVITQTVRMPLDETIETYSYFLKEAEKLNLAYFCFLRYLDALDVLIDGMFGIRAIYYPI